MEDPTIDDYYSGDDEENNFEVASDVSDTENPNPKSKSKLGVMNDKKMVIMESDDEDEKEEEEEDKNIEDENNEEDEYLDEEDDDVEDYDDEDEPNQVNEVKTQQPKKTANMLPEKLTMIQTGGLDDDEIEDDDEDEEDEMYFQKFEKGINKDQILDFHPECIIHNYEEISALTKIIRDKNNTIVDPLHRTIPFLTKYEKTRVLGQRAKQINVGAKPFVKVPENIIDGYLIAEIELAQKRIPFIIRRPLPSGGSEYWNVKDLELIDF